MALAPQHDGIIFGGEIEVLHAGKRGLFPSVVNMMTYEKTLRSPECFTLGGRLDGRRLCPQRPQFGRREMERSNHLVARNVCPDVR